jgi:hypothetical protein
VRTRRSGRPGLAEVVGAGQRDLALVADLILRMDRQCSQLASIRGGRDRLQNLVAALTWSSRQIGECLERPVRRRR